MSGDDEYLALLRGTLPSDDDKARARNRLAALGVAVAAAQVAPVAAAKAFSFALVGKVLVAAGGVAALGLVVMSSRERAPVHTDPAPIVHIEPVAAPPAAEPEAADAPVAESPIKVKRPRRARAHVATADTLAAENALLSGAVRALHAGDVARAAKLLDEHAATYPDGLLANERERARKKLVSE